MSDDNDGWADGWLNGWMAGWKAHLALRMLLLLLMLLLPLVGAGAAAGVVAGAQVEEGRGEGVAEAAGLAHQGVKDRHLRRLLCGGLVFERGGGGEMAPPVWVIHAGFGFFWGRDGVGRSDFYMDR